jgi:hypothetical protein
MSVLAVVCFALPGLRTGAWAAIGVTSALAVWSGLATHRPTLPGPWKLLAGAAVAYGAGDLFPVVADAVYLDWSYPCCWRGWWG